MGLSVLKLSSRHDFHIQGHCDHDLRPSDPKVDRGHLLIITPYQVLGRWALAFISYQPETIFTFKVTVTLTFELVTRKSIGVIYPS